MDDIKQAVTERYGKYASAAAGSCCGSSCSCAPAAGTEATLAIGYDADELSAIPQSADLGLGCGNPLALASLGEGERVLDLGSGGGIDCFLAARRVGPTGHVIGVDMTPEMIALARRNAVTTGFDNVEFRLGEIEHLPVEDASIDVIISNCVINLVPDKARAFAESFRVLAPGGRLLVSDIVVLEEIPARLKESERAYTGCLAGAVPASDYLEGLASAGFTDVEVLDEKPYCASPDDAFALELIASAGLTDDDVAVLTRAFASARISARKRADA